MLMQFMYLNVMYSRLGLNVNVAIHVTLLCHVWRYLSILYILLAKIANVQQNMQAEGL